MQSWWPMLVLAILAGMFIAFGSLAALVAQSNLPDTGAAQLLAGATFSIGLMMVMVVGAELFTGNTLMMVPLATGLLTPGRMLGAWVVVWTGNLIGSVMVALLFHASGGLTEGVAEAAVSVAKSKLDKPPLVLFASAILANVLV